MSGVDEQYIEELARDRQNAWSSFRKEVEADILARNNKDFTLEDVPEAYRSTTDIPKVARIPDIAQRLIAVCTDDDPAISVRPTAETDKATRNASLREKFLAGTIEVQNNDAGRDVWRMAMDSALTKRLGIIKVVLRKDYWSGEPSKDDYTDSDKYLEDLADYRKGAPFPIVWEDIDPITYLPDRVGTKPSEVLEITERPLLPTMRALGVKGSWDGHKIKFRKLRLGEKFPVDGGLGSGAPHSGKCTEYWTNNELVYLLDGKKVEEVEHNYGRPPYFSFGSYTTPSRKPDEAYNSVVGLLRDQVKSFKRFLAIKSNWAYLAGWPFFEEDSSRPQSGTNNFSQIEAGAILRGIKIMAVPNVGDDLNQMIQIWQSEIDRSGLAAVMFGQGSGTTSGYQVASLQAAAQSVLKPVIRNAARALGDALSFEQELIDKHVFKTKEGRRVGGASSKVYVWTGGEGDESGKYLGLGPDDINGYYPVTVALRPMLPLDEIAQRDSALRMFQGGLYDPETALSKTGEEQPEEIVNKRLAYDYLQKSGLSMRLAEDAARRQGLLPKENPAAALVGPSGAPLLPRGTGGPGIGMQGPIAPSVPGAGMPLRPTPPPMGGANMPEGVQRGPGGPEMRGPVG